MTQTRALATLPKEDKKALTHIMHESGISFRDMEQYLGADHATLSRWAKEEVDEEKMQQIATVYSKEIGHHKRKILYQVLNRLETLVPRETDIDKVVRAGQFIEGKDKSDKSQTNVQVNVQAINEKVKAEYGEF